MSSGRKQWALPASLTAILVLPSLGQNLPVPPLPYHYSGLSPGFISERAVRVHHLGHHASDTFQLNSVLEKMRWDPSLKHLAKMGIDELLHHLDEVPEEYRHQVRKAGGGFVNHDLFWKILTPWGGHQPGPDSETIQERKLADAIKTAFGSFEDMQYLFSNMSSAFCGSGWVFLYYDKKAKSLEIDLFKGQDTPAMDPNLSPILLLDLWEHAYYLDYENRKDMYISHFWEAVNWPEVATLYALASGVVEPEPLPSAERQEKNAIGLIVTDDTDKALLQET